MMMLQYLIEDIAKFAYILQFVTNFINNIMWSLFLAASSFAKQAERQQHNSHPN